MWTTPQFKFNDKQLIKCRFSIKGWLTGFEPAVNKRYQNHNLTESTTLPQTPYYNIIGRGIRTWTLIDDFGDRYSNQLNYTPMSGNDLSIKILHLRYCPIPHLVNPGFSQMAVHTGVEPAPYSVTGRYLNRLTYGL